MSEILKRSLGEESAALFDQHVLDYLGGTVEFIESAEEVEDALGPLLEPYLKEEETKRVCEEIQRAKFGQVSSGGASHAPLDEEFVPLAESVSLKSDLLGRENIGGEVDEQEEIGVVLKKKKDRGRKKILELTKGTEVDNMVFRRSNKPFSDIHLEGIDLQMGKGSKLIDNGELHLVMGRRYALVGLNGAGKSTLLRAMSSNELKLPPCSLIHVDQECHGEMATSLETVLRADVERTELIAEAAELEDKTDDASGARLAVVYERMAEIDVDAQQAKASRILSGLGFSEEMQSMPTKSLSGGWRMRVSLARALFCTPDLLLLDEVTNHLDLKAKLWVEHVLREWPESRTIVCVSHDRTFLNSGFVTDVIHLHSQKLFTYPGDYDQFEKARFARLRAQQKAHDAQEAHKQHVQKFIDRFRFNAKRAAMVQSRIKMLQKLEAVPEAEEDPEFQFHFPSGTGARDPLVRFTDVTFGYTRDKVLYRNLSFTLLESSRICLVGDNGVGKSTLVKLMLQQLHPVEGEVYVDGRLKIGYFSQHHVDAMDLDDTPLELLQKACPGLEDEQAYRTILGRYRVSGSMADQPIGTLSGGQRSRVAFSLIGAQKPQLLVLDEVESHLDIASVDALAIALNEYEGGILMVSHDERLLQLVCDELWILEEGAITEWKGDFAEYRRQLVKKVEKFMQ